MTDIQNRCHAPVLKRPGIGGDTALRRMAAGQMPAHQIEIRRKFKRAEIDEWVKSGTAEEKQKNSLQIFRKCVM